MKGRKLLVSLLTAVALVAVMTVPAIPAIPGIPSISPTPAMAANETSVSATVEVGETISFTITDTGLPGLDFGSLNAGDTDKPETAQNATAPAVTLTVGSETNVNCNIQTKAADFSGPGSLTIGNAKWDVDSGVAGATPMTVGYDTITTSTAGAEEAQDVWHWLTIPGGTVAGTYTTIFWYQATKQA